MKDKPSLLIIGNSNVGKSSITRLLHPNPSKFKGKSGKKPGSTLLIKTINIPQMPYNIVDLPGFGYMKSSSRRREEHLKKQLIIHIEKHHREYILGLVVINITRIEDELNKYFVQNTKTIPLSFELINFLRESEISIIVIINKIDKVSNFDKNKIISFFIESAKEYGINIVLFDNYNPQNETEIPFLEFSALKKTNEGKLKQIIQKYLK